MPAKIETINIDNLIKLYLSGISIKKLAQKIHHSRQVVYRILNSEGIQIRNRSESMFTRMSRLSFKAKQKLTQKAHQALRKNGQPVYGPINRAKGCQQKLSRIGFGEVPLNNWLNERGVYTIPQMAVDRYNIDIAASPVAVELLISTHLCIHRKNDFEKIKYLTNHGWRVLYIQLRNRESFSEIFADYIVSFIDETRLNPSLIGQYRVIGRNLEIKAEGRLYPD